MFNNKMQNLPLNYKYWEYFLKRKLNDKEKKLIKDVHSENLLNKVLQNIHEKVIKDKLYIPMLTPDDGNCLFSSLCYHKFANDIPTLKKGLSNMLVFFKDMKNFIPGQDTTLSELFTMYNEIEFVFCYNEQKLYKYNYDAMCLDLLSNDGWKRINTELLFTIMSIVMNVRFLIYHNNGHITKICPDGIENEKTKNVYLAHMGESHYIPLDEIDQDKPLPSCIESNQSYNAFITWTRKVIEENNSYQNKKYNDDDDGLYYVDGCLDDCLDDDDD